MFAWHSRRFASSLEQSASTPEHTSGDAICILIWCRFTDVDQV